MKYKVGDKFRLIGGSRDGELGTVINVWDGTNHPYQIEVDSARDLVLCCNELGTPNCFQDEWTHAELITDETLKHLPPKFKLNPGGNEALSRAMQERLFELGYKWISAPIGTPLTEPHGEEWNYIFSVNDYQINAADDIRYANGALLTLDDLYKLTPAPQELSKLEIAGRTLELKDGRVVGPDFEANIGDFRRFIDRQLDEITFCGHPTRINSLQVGCQIVTREDLQRALTWAQEVTSE